MRLISAIKIQAQCETDSELRNLSKEKKKRIAKLVKERVPSGLAPIEEWNEVISCFVDAEPETDNKKAKRKLLSILLNQEYKGDTNLFDDNKWQFKNRK